MFLSHIPASMCLLRKQQIKSGEKLERWLTSTIVIDSNLRLDRSVHDDVVNLEDFAKADTQWDQVFVVDNIEGPHAARPEVVPASDGQSCDWLKYYRLCLRAGVLACKRMLPIEDSNQYASGGKPSKHRRQ